MRTLKKSLSLVLVLAMVCSFFVMGTSAAFEDADEITAKYAEAVEVLNALEVLQGSDGSYDPQGTLTRAAAARIIVAMLGAEDLAKTAKCTFTDVAVTDWFYDEIAYCQSIGLMKGYGDGTVGPNDQLTGAQFALMVMKAAGVDTSSVDPNAFELTVTSLAVKEGLASVEEVAAVPFTREMAAQMAYNGLFYSEDATDIYWVVKTVGEGDDAVVTYVEYYTSHLEALLVVGQLNEAAAEGTTYSVEADEDTDDTLAAEVFGVLRNKNATDYYGNPATRYYYARTNATLAFSAKTASATYANERVSQQDLVNDLGLGSNSSYYTVTVKVDGETTIAADDWAWGANAGARSKAFIAGIGLGSEVNVYLNAATRAITVVVVNPHFGTVSNVTKATETEDRYITIAGMDYETEDFAKFDDVLYTVGDGTIVTVSALEPLSGTISKVTSAGVYTIDGVEYAAAIGVELDGWAANAKVYFYVDTYGNVIGTWAPVEAYEKGDYILVLDSAATKTALGTSDNTVDVYGIILGETSAKTITFAEAKAPGAVSLAGKAAHALGQVVTNPMGVITTDNSKIYEYSISTVSGNYNLDSLTPASIACGVEIADGANSVTVDDTTYIINNNTTFVFVSKGMMGWEVELVEGSANLNCTVSTSRLLVGTDDDDNALVEYVVVMDEYAGAVAATEDLVYITGMAADVSYVTEGNGFTSTITATYNAYDVEGEKVTIVEEDNDYVAHAAGIYYLNEDGTVKTPAAASTKYTVAAVAGTTIFDGTNYLALTSDTVVIDLSLNGDGDIDKNDHIFYVADGTDLVLVYIVD